MKASSTYTIETVHGVKEKIDLVRLARLRREAIGKSKRKKTSKRGRQ